MSEIFLWLIVGFGKFAPWFGLSILTNFGLVKILEKVSTNWQKTIVVLLGNAVVAASAISYANLGETSSKDSLENAVSLGLSLGFFIFWGYRFFDDPVAPGS